MKKLITFLAVSITAIAVAAADPIIVGHGFVNLNALGTTYDGSSDTMSAMAAFGDNVSAGGGVGVNIPFGGYFGIQPEVDFYFNRIGFKEDTFNNIYTNSYVSLDIPVLFTAKVEKWNFKLGPYLSIPLGNLKTQTKYSGGGTSDATSYDINNGVNVGLLLGVGYEERLGMGRIVFGVNYMLDFLSTETKVPTLLGGTSIDKQFTRRGLMFDIGYKVPLSF